MSDALRKYCSGGGWTAKFGPEALSSMLGNIPKKGCNDLLVGYESSDDAAVYKLSEDLAVVQTLDFFTPIVPDPYSFGKIAAANALSDIYAMGGQVKVALNIVAFPETMDLGVLEDILRGGAEKVHEAGGVLSGGHSITDASPKYGLSVTGTVHPDKVLKNNGCKEKDKIILTKPLGVGIIMTAANMGKALEADFAQAVLSMETINKYAADIMRKYPVNACTDVTGFGFMGHLAEMVPQGLSALADTKNIKYIDGAYKLAEEFYITGAGQKNANFLKGKVLFDSDVPFAMKEILYDPQTSGGLLISLPEDEADRLNDELNANGIDACIAACVTLGKDYKIVVI